MSDDILCEMCVDHYSELLRAQRERTVEFNSRTISRTQPTSVAARRLKENAGREGQVEQVFLDPMQKMQESEIETKLPNSPSESVLLRRQRRTTNLVGMFLLGIGVLVLTVAVALTSTVSAFVGLGLTFWGMLAFFVQPNSYIKSELLNATAISSLRTVDKMMVAMGYGEKGVYIEAGDSNKAVVFIPSEPFSKIPEVSDMPDAIFLPEPKGLLVPPPGSALMALIENKLGFNLKNCGLEALIDALPKVLVEDLEIVKDVEIEVSGDTVRFKLYDSIYANFCSEIRETSRRCGLGCPMCSALASILTIATGKPIVYLEDKDSEAGRITESVYQIVSGRRL